MKHHNTVFHQILKVLPRQRFQAVVGRQDEGRRILQVDQAEPED